MGSVSATQDGKREENLSRERNWIMLFKCSSKKKRQKRNQKDFKPKVSDWITSFPFNPFWWGLVPLYNFETKKKKYKRVVGNEALFEMVISFWLIYMPFNVHLSIGGFLYPKSLRHTKQLRLCFSSFCESWKGEKKSRGELFLTYELLTAVLLFLSPPNGFPFTTQKTSDCDCFYCERQKWHSQQKKLQRFGFEHWKLKVLTFNGTFILRSSSENTESKMSLWTFSCSFSR